MRKSLVLIALLAPLSARAQEETSPPPPPPADTPAPPLVAAPPSKEPPSLQEPIARDDGMVARVGLKVLGGTVALTGGIALAMAAHSSCTASCAALDLLAATPAVLFFMPFGVWLTGRLIGAPGGYWWTVLGAIPGWALAVVTYLVAGTPNGRINPWAFASWVLPVFSGVVVHELTAPPPDVTAMPWFDGRGGGGLSVAIRFP